MPRRSDGVKSFGGYRDCRNPDTTGWTEDPRRCRIRNDEVESLGGLTGGYLVIEHPLDEDYYESVELFNAQEFVVWTNGPDKFGRYIALTLSTRDGHTHSRAPTGVGNTPSDAVRHAWRRFDVNREEYGRTPPRP
jgi:hypothetical protein